MEHRCGNRRETRLKVRLRTGNGIVAEGVILDISSSGALVRTLLPASLFTSVRVQIMKLSASRGQVSAQVVRVVPGGFAVEWSEFACEPVRIVLQHLAREEYSEDEARIASGLRVPLRQLS